MLLVSKRARPGSSPTFTAPSLLPLEHEQHALAPTQSLYQKLYVRIEKPVYNRGHRRRYAHGLPACAGLTFGESWDWRRSFVTECLGRQDPRRRPGRIEGGDQRDSDGQQGDQYAIDGVWCERHVVNGVHLGSQGK